MRILMLVAMAGLFLASGTAQESWVLFPNQGETTRDQLKLYLNKEGKKHLRERQLAVSALRTGAEAAARQKVVREKILRLMGGLPAEKGPLRTRQSARRSATATATRKSSREPARLLRPGQRHLPARPLRFLDPDAGRPQPDGKEGERPPPSVWRGKALSCW